MEKPLSARRVRTSPSWISTIRDISSLPRRLKIKISSILFRNSGLNDCERVHDCIAHSLVVSTIASRVFRDAGFPG